MPITSTVRQALAKIKAHTYTAVPLVDTEGHYIATLTEGDLLWLFGENLGDDMIKVGKLKLSAIPLRTENRSVGIGASLSDLLGLLGSQNFVPVVDDEGVFIGIVRRREIIDLCAGFLRDKYGENIDSFNSEVLLSIQDVSATR